MATISKAGSLPASVQEVWSVLADFASISAWAPNVDHSCLLTEQTGDVGAVRRIQSGRITVRETVTAWDPESELAYEITGLPRVVQSVTNTWTLVADGDATVATLTTEVLAGSRPPQRLIANAVVRTFAKASDQMLSGLAAHLNARQPA